MVVNVCVGSSCHLKGSYDVIQTLKRLIEENGLKGMSVGGAMVSEKHAGFVINYKNASCKDVRELINRIAECVFENNGVKLQPEVIFVGR